MLLLIDNYDSFTYNLVHYIGELGVACVVRRNDDLTTAQVRDLAPKAIVISPGPCTPNEAGICLDLIGELKGSVPLLGVCLGHQSIAQAYGGDVIRAPTPMHGKLSQITSSGQGVFDGLPQRFEVTRYHSLTVQPDTLPDCLEATAHTDDGIIMGLQHKEHPVHGVQFHPESIASEHGHAILGNFLRVAGFKPKAITRARPIAAMDPSAGSGSENGGSAMPGLAECGSAAPLQATSQGQ